MKISLNALKQHLDFDLSVDQFNDILPMLGFEVDSIQTTGLADLPKVVVGQVLKKDKHPDADKLSVCTVNVGQDEPLQIVCGASNFKESDHVPVALIGARLPNGLKIKKGKLRGVVSFGMMCSADELGLGDGSAGLHILEDKPSAGTPINDAIHVESDTIFDLELTANRGDCSNHRGIARELAAHLRKPLKPLNITNAAVSTNDSINVTDTTNCPYYCAFKLSGATVKDSPAWLKDYLEKLGLRPINNVVDVTNYIMFELGQPLHAFDAAKVEGNITIRGANDKEKIKTLDEQEFTLNPNNLVIADSAKAIAIAGVMGAANSEVSQTTTDIILEAAYFNPSSVKQTARSLGVHTDSAYRFARDVDPEMTLPAASKAIELICELTGATAQPTGTAIGQPPRSACVIEVSHEFIQQKCGFEIDANQVEEIYKSLGFEVAGDAKQWTVTVPTFRSEVCRPIDLVEEFVRVYGTDKIPNARVTSVGLTREDNCDAVVVRLASDYLAANGFQEFYNYSFLNKDQGGVALENPLTAEHTHVRSTLLHGLVESLKFNQNHGNTDLQGAFEAGRVLRTGKEPGTFGEYLAITFVQLVEPQGRNWLERQGPDFFSAKNVMEQVGRCLNFKLGELKFESTDSEPMWQAGHSAVAGDLDSDQYEFTCGVLDMKHVQANGVEGMVLAGEVVIDREYLISRKSKRERFEAFSQYPSVKKDLALLVPQEMAAVAVCELVEGLSKSAMKGSEIDLEPVRVFDVYTGEGLEPGKKSLALEFEFRAADRTLTDKEVMGVFDKLCGLVDETEEVSVRAR